MGSTGASDKEQKEMVVSQVSIGGFDDGVTAKQLADFLEDEAGLIWRCRVKTSCTPMNAFPDFNVVPTPDTPRVHESMKDYPRHAFVHFAYPEAAERAINAAGRCELVFDGRVLRAISGIDSSFRVNRRRTINPFKFQNVGVEIGNLVTRDKFWASWRTTGVDFVIDPFDGRCRILFAKDTIFSLKGEIETVAIRCDFKLEFMVRDVNEVKVYTDQSPFVLLLHLSSVPWVYYRTADDNIYESIPSVLLDDEDPWIRTTDFTPAGAIGRCNYYQISISPRFGAKLERALSYMKQWRIPETRPGLRIENRDEPDFGQLSSDPFFGVHKREGISFTTMYLVNALVHKGIINQHQLSNEFFNLLRSRNDIVNETSLRHIWSYKRPIFDAHRRLKLVQRWLLNNPKLLKHSPTLDDYVEVRRLAITPTKAHCLPPELELANRVLRNYKAVSDRFLRVTFTDEAMQQLNSNVLNYYVAPIVRASTMKSFSQRTTIFRRVRSILNDGFHLCDRKYSFLAFSSNQLRDRSAWFFAEDERTQVVKIRKWMGKFSNKNVAKCAARMGQCFSSTYATVEMVSKEVNFALADIKRNGYDFSDGIGKLTPDLAMEVAEKLQLTENPPSAYQIRYAGCKGVVAVWPGNDNGFRLSLRPSMNKFASSHTMLEVVSWTRFQPGFLNRQIVTLLSALKVPDNVFAKMQDSMISMLNEMLVDPDVAFEVLTKSCADQGNMAAIMLSAGFEPQSEPHLKGMLSCIRSGQLGDLLNKSRIFVKKGRWLMGCLDELAILEQGQCFIQASTPSLENCFSKHGSRFSGSNNEREVIIGPVVIAKNPCLHPGDIRILEAVDVPGLHHLVNCLIFPQKGDRPHANEASGSDLDGDLYFVTWDENLVPPSKKSWTPMDYTPEEPKRTPHGQVTSQDIIDFFVKNMVNENLGVICNAHVVHADRSEEGALDANCLKLAELAAIAVDFPKTGNYAIMPQELKPKIYPDFMGKDEFQSYKSEKILGKLYRTIKDATDIDVGTEITCTGEDLPYDQVLEILGSKDYVADAWHNKCLYDGQLNALLGQYRVSSEGEIITGHVWSLPNYSSRKQGQLKERLKNAYSSLHKEFRRIFEGLGPDFLQLTSEEKNVLYEMKASAWYQVTYHPQWVQKSRELREPDEDGGNDIPSRLSFAWIATDYLVRIKVRGREPGKLKSKKPVDLLASYLSERL